MIEESLPPNTDLVAVPSGAIVQGDNVIWNIASIPPGPTTIYSQSIRLMVKASAADGDRVQNHVSITSTELPAAKTDSVDLPIVAAAVSR